MTGAAPRGRDYSSPLGPALLIQRPVVKRRVSVHDSYYGVEVASRSGGTVCLREMRGWNLWNGVFYGETDATIEIDHGTFWLPDCQGVPFDFSEVDADVHLTNCIIAGWWPAAEPWSPPRSGTMSVAGTQIFRTRVLPHWLADPPGLDPAVPIHGVESPPASRRRWGNLPDAGAVQITPPPAPPDDTPAAQPPAPDPAPPPRTGREHQMASWEWLATADALPHGAGCTCGCFARLTLLRDAILNASTRMTRREMMRFVESVIHDDAVPWPSGVDGTLFTMERTNG